MRALLSPGKNGKNGPKLKKGDVTEHIIVATVRYALSMAEKGVFDPSELEMIIVDEADNMLGDDTENKQVGCGLLPAASRLFAPIACGLNGAVCSVLLGVVWFVIVAMQLVACGAVPRPACVAGDAAASVWGLPFRCARAYAPG